MKILHIHPSLAGGGIEAMICALTNEMVKTHDITICTIFTPSESDVFERKLDNRIHRYSLQKIKPGFSVSEIFKIYKFIKSGKYDVVHIHGFFYYYALSVFLLHETVKFFYTVHSDARMENASWDRHLFLLKKWSFKLGYIHPITISSASKESFGQLYHVESRLIYNGVAKPDVSTDNGILSEYKHTELTKVFIHPGRITEAKNQIVLCKVFDRIIAEGNDVILIIAGSKQDLQIYSQLEPFFNDRILYLGERDDIPALLAESDAMCLPSIWEGLPITLLEALSVGCIPICSPVGGIVDVIKPGYNGFMSSDSSEEEYYKTISDFLRSDESYRKEIRENCIESFKPYDIITCCKQYLDAYAGV